MLHGQSQRTASSVRSLHLLRALLREASYLPDQVARQYFRRYIVDRFRAYQPAHNATAWIHAQVGEKYRHRSFRRRHVSIINARTRVMQRKAQKGLNYLRRATQGEAPCLEKALLFAYGRVGRRRYALVENLMRPDPGTECAPGDAPLQKLYRSTKRYLSFFDTPKPETKARYVIDISDRYSRLKTVVKSQCARGVALGSDLKRHNLLTPVYNVWQRPMPIKRARNNVRRWYAATMARLLPPLPNDEWDVIRAMITGERRVSFANRRKPALSVRSESVEEDEKWKGEVLQGLALAKPSRADRPAGTQRPHNLNPRYMRRLYSRIHAYCCKLEWNEERHNWTAVWGGQFRSLSRCIYSAATDDDLFAGVAADGRVVQQPEPKTAVEKKGRRRYTVVPFYVDFLPSDHPVRKEADTFRRERDQSA